jgi:protein ImuB
MPRPVWLLDAPLPLDGGLLLEQGPERIESGWWDGNGVARDYYIARQVGTAARVPGARLWVFQERHSKRWYLHGVFA